MGGPGQEKKARPQRSPLNPPCARYSLERRLAVSPFSPRPPPQRTGGRRSRARHMAPAPHGFGLPGGGGGGEGPPRDSQRRLQAARSAAPASQPPPRRATPDTHPRGWHDGGSGDGKPARSATDCPFPPAFPRHPAALWETQSPRVPVWHRCSRRKLQFPACYAPRPRHGPQRGR